MTKTRNGRKVGNSGYRGVTPIGDKYRAQISITKDGKMRNHSLGHYYDPVKAAQAYDRAAKWYFGDNADLNFPDAG